MQCRNKNIQVEEEEKVYTDATELIYGLVYLQCYDEVMLYDVIDWYVFRVVNEGETGFPSLCQEMLCCDVM